jgi:3-oxoacyl-[acyl-carrier-protein] synthase-3
MYARVTGTGSYAFRASQSAMTTWRLVASTPTTSGSFRVPAFAAGIWRRRARRPAIWAWSPRSRRWKWPVLPAGEIDLIIVATSTPDFIFPSTACLIQGRLGNKQGRCRVRRPGRLQRLCLRPGDCRKVHPLRQPPQGAGHRCRSLFADSRLERPRHLRAVRRRCRRGGARGSKAGNPGDGDACRRQPERHPERSRQVCGGQVTGDPFLRMDGQAVFKFAVRVLAEVAEEVCDAGTSNLRDVTG